MGRSKALLPDPGSGEPLVVRLAHSLSEGGATPVLVIGRADDNELRTVVGAIAPVARFVENPEADAGGQLSSLVAAIDALEAQRAPGVLMTPVDVPRIRPATVAALLAAFRAAPGQIVRAVHANRHGHPVIFPRALFDDLRHADPAQGARAILRAHEADILDVDVPDPGVIDDIDTPDAYRRVFGEE